MDKQSLHENSGYLCRRWPFGPEFDVFKIGGEFLCCRRSCAASFINPKKSIHKNPC